MRYSLFIYLLLHSSLIYAQYTGRSINPDFITEQKKIESHDAVPLSYTSPIFLDHFLLFGWNISRAHNKFVRKWSVIGLQLSYMHQFDWLKENWKIGGEYLWSVYTKKEPYQTYVSGNTSTSAEVHNYIYAHAIMIKLSRIVAIKDHIFLYGGLGAGSQYLKTTQYFNIYNLSEKGWGGAGKSEFGVLIFFPRNVSTGIHISTYYIYATNRNFNMNRYQQYGLTIGMTRNSR